MISFKNRHIDYLYRDELQAFKAIEFNLDGTSFKNIYSNYFENLDPVPTSFKLLLYGPCIIRIPIPELGPYLVENLTKGFFLF